MSESSTQGPAARGQAGEASVARHGYVPSTGKLVVAIVVLLWGVGVVSNGLMGHHATGNSAYDTGRMVGWLFGFALVFAGARQLWFEIRARR
jgi:hypothetical protein